MTDDRDLAAALAQALGRLEAAADPAKSPIFRSYHKVDRPYLGVAMPAVDALARAIAVATPPSDVIALAGALWDTDIFEARLLAARLLGRPQLKDIAAIWTMIGGWLADFDSWAIADAVAKAGARCLRADPHLLDDVERWTVSESFWIRRAALVFTLDWAKQGRNPDRMLRWMDLYVGDKEWFIGKAIGWWLRELSKHDPERVRRFLAKHENRLAAVTRREATKYL